MSKAFEWVGKILGSLLGLLVLLVALLYLITSPRINRIYDIPAPLISVQTDAASVERGQHLVTTVGLCQECHADNLAGHVLDEGVFIGRLVASNLTPGKGGIDHTVSDEDLMRAIRHGVGRDGKSLIAMSSNVYYDLGDADLAAMIAYLRSLPPIDSQLPDTRLGPLARLYILMDPSILVAQVIDHSAPRPATPPPGVTVEYGYYLSLTCRVCHAANLAGEPGAGGGLNLTPGGELATWTRESFIRTLRTGITPTGKQLDSEDMPWRAIGSMTDDELGAIWLYLQSLPPVKTEVAPK